MLGNVVVEWANWCKSLLKNLYQIHDAKPPLCLSWNYGFFKIFIWGAIAPQSQHLSSHPRPFPLPQSKVLWTNDRDYIQPQTSKYYWSSRSRLKIPYPTQNLMKKALLETTVNSQSYLNRFSPIVRSLGTPNGTSLHHLTPMGLSTSNFGIWIELCQGKVAQLYDVTVEENDVLESQCSWFVWVGNLKLRA